MLLILHFKSLFDDLVLKYRELLRLLNMLVCRHFLTIFELNAPSQQHITRVVQRFTRRSSSLAVALHRGQLLSRLFWQGMLFALSSLLLFALCNKRGRVRLRHHYLRRVVGQSRLMQHDVIVVKVLLALLLLVRVGRKDLVASKCEDCTLRIRFLLESGFNTAGAALADVAAHDDS